jgi:hypothetical protein
MKNIAKIAAIFTLILTAYMAGKISERQKISQRFEEFTQDWVGSDLYHIEKVWLFEGRKVDNFGYPASDEEWILEVNENVDKQYTYSE